MEWEAPLYHGGPVEQNSLHFIHSRPDIGMKGKEVLPGIFWGGDFNHISHLIAEGLVKPDECRFFIGYSGWGKQQLANEMKTESWYTTKGSHELVFDHDVENQWRNVLKSMGPEYSILSGFPDDPRFN